MKKQKRKKQEKLIELGNLSPEKARILLIVVAIIGVVTVDVVRGYFNVNKPYISEQTIIVKSPRDPQLERDVSAMLKGYPMENMAPYIATKDRNVAAFLVGIAKKESNWGKRTPIFAGRDCYNYWGFRLKTDVLGSGGHSCFSSPKEAVDTVADRVSELINEEHATTPKKMVVWKCGYNCDGHSPQSVKKWIADVGYYYKQIIN